MEAWCSMSTKRQNNSAQRHQLHSLAMKLVKAENRGNKILMVNKRKKPLSR